MVLVTKDRRRGGVGTGLLKRCIDEVRAADAVAGPRCDGAGAADLPAAGISRPLPDRALALRRRERRGRGTAGRRHDPADHAGRPAAARHLRPAADRHGAAVDPDASGPASARPRLAGGDVGGKIVGFALGREGRVATSLGPVVADREAIALALISRAAAAAPGPFIIDVPEAHRGGRAPGCRSRGRPRRAATCG